MKRLGAYESRSRAPANDRIRAATGNAQRGGNALNLYLAGREKHKVSRPGPPEREKSETLERL